jgi:hypothetical protein
MTRAEMWQRLAFVADQDKKRDLAIRMFELHATDEDDPDWPGGTKH